MNVFTRELVHLGRDWREYAIGAGYAVFLVLVLGGLELWFLGHLRSTEVPTTRLAVQGLEHADAALRETLARRRLRPVEFSGDLTAAVRTGREAWGLLLPVPGSAEPAAILVNSSARSFFVARAVELERLKLALHDYRQQRAHLADAPAREARVLTVHDVSQGVRRQGLGPMAFKIFLLLMMLVSGAYLVDMLAGERRATTLEALLATPASGARIVFGKVLAGYVVSLSILTSMVLVIWGSIMMLPARMTDGTRFSWASAITVILAAVALGYVTSAVQFTLGGLIDDYERSQTIVAVAGTLLLMLGLWASVRLPSGAGLYFVPVLGAFELIDAWSTSGQVPLVAAFIATTASALAGSLLAGLFAGLGFDRERLLYGRIPRPSEGPSAAAGEGGE